MFIACLLVNPFQCYFQFNGTHKRPRLSVFCSDKQLYAILVDDQNKKCLFYGSTLQKSIRDDPTVTTSVSTPYVLESFEIFMLVERNLGFKHTRRLISLVCFPSSFILVHVPLVYIAGSC